MAADELFGELPLSRRSRKRTRRRLARRGCQVSRNATRSRCGRCGYRESLIGEDHPARLIWSYVGELDLSELENRIKARGDRPGITPRHRRDFCWRCGSMPPARASVARGRWNGWCESHDAYRWLCGGVTVNYHLLADFRASVAPICSTVLLRDHLARRWQPGRPRQSGDAGTGRRAGPGWQRGSRPCSGARRHSNGIWHRLRRWWKTSSARSMHAPMPAISAPGRPRSAARASCTVKAAQTGRLPRSAAAGEREEKRGNGGHS